MAFCKNCGLWLVILLTTAETNMTYIVVNKLISIFNFFIEQKFCIDTD